jgi:hypothetical protein
MNSIQLDNIRAPFIKFGKFFVAHDKIIYFVLFFCVIIGAILGLNLALYQPSDEDYRSQKLSETQSARFDTETIDKIQQLNAQQQTNTDSIPTGKRVNPFGE